MYVQNFILISSSDDQNEVKLFHKQYFEEVPGGYILQKDFHLLTERMGIKDAFLSQLCFNAFDLNHDSKIDFYEFLLGMSVITRGTFDEKLECLFII